MKTVINNEPIYIDSIFGLHIKNIFLPRLNKYSNNCGSF